MIRMQGYTVAIYIDDIIAIDQSFEECLLVVAKTINLFQKLGFVIHSKKGNFITAKKIVTYLSEKTKKYKKCCTIPVKPKLAIREFASFIGTLKSTFPGHQFGPLHYRAMLKLKEKSLKDNKDNFNEIIKLPKVIMHEMSR